MDMIPEGDDEGKYKPEFRASLLRSLYDLKRGRGYPLEQVEKENIVLK